MADPKPVIVDLLSLAFSRSPMRESLTHEVLTARLDLDAMMRGNVLQLEPLWKLAKEQPEFDAKVATVPICFFKTQERRLGVIVELPADLKQLGSSDITTMAALCNVKKDELDRMLARLGDSLGRRTTTPAAGGPTSTRRMTPAPGVPTASQSGSPIGSSGSMRKATREMSPAVTSAKPASNRRTLAIVGGVLMAAAVGLMSVTIMHNCAGGAPKWQTLSADAFKGIPVSNIRVLGNQAEATLSDPGWLAQSEDAKRDQLVATLQALSARKISVLAIRDADKKVRAAVQWDSHSPPNAVTKFY